MDAPQYSAIIRDVEMLLDQLYYWSRRACERRGDPNDAGIAGRMLELATKNLQRFVTTLLDCFGPIELAPAPTPASDLVAAIALCARRELDVTSVTVSGEADQIVLADAPHLARAWPGILRHLDPNAGGALHVTIACAQREARYGIEITLRPGAKPRALAARDGAVQLEWTLARRIVALHGGEMQDHADPRERAIVVFLPATTPPPPRT